MIARTLLSETVSTASQNDSGMKSKGKLVVGAVVAVGIILLLRRHKRGSHDAMAEEDESDTEEEPMEMPDDHEDIEVEVAGNGDESESSNSGGLAAARSELDMFDMLAIAASAFKAAKKEYDYRVRP